MSRQKIEFHPTRTYKNGDEIFIWVGLVACVDPLSWGCRLCPPPTQVTPALKTVECGYIRQVKTSHLVDLYKSLTWPIFVCLLTLFVNRFAHRVPSMKPQTPRGHHQSISTCSSACSRRNGLTRPTKNTRRRPSRTWRRNEKNAKKRSGGRLYSRNKFVQGLPTI